MALTIESEEADRLARELSDLTGETTAKAVTEALRERLEQLRRERTSEADTVEQVRRFAQSIAHRYDRRPVTRAEWDTACGEPTDKQGL